MLMKSDFTETKKLFKKSHNEQTTVQKEQLQGLLLQKMNKKNVSLSIFITPPNKAFAT